MKSLRSFPAPSPCSGLLSTVNMRLLKCFSKVHMSFSSCPTKICVLVMETISNRWRQAYCNKRRLFIKVAAPTVFPFTSWGLFIMAFVVFPTAWLQETPRFGNLSSIRMVLSCSGPAAHRIEYGKKVQKGWRACVFWRSLTSSSIGFLLGGRVHWKLRAWVGGVGPACAATVGESSTMTVMPVTVSIRTNPPMDTSAFEELASLGSHSSLSLYLGKVWGFPFPLDLYLEMLGNLQIQVHAFFRLWLLSDFCL